MSPHWVMSKHFTDVGTLCTHPESPGRHWYLRWSRRTDMQAQKSEKGTLLHEGPVSGGKEVVRSLAVIKVSIRSLEVSPRVSAPPPVTSVAPPRQGPNHPTQPGEEPHQSRPPPGIGPGFVPRGMSMCQHFTFHQTLAYTFLHFFVLAPFDKHTV